MANYKLTEFANLVNMSPKTIRRHIKDGHTPDGKKWRKPPKVKGRYVFTDSDLDLWNVQDVHSGKDVQTISGHIETINRLIDDKDKLQRDVQELKALRAKNESYERDIERINENFHRVETEKKTLNENFHRVEIEKKELEDKLLRVETEKKQLEDRSFFQRLFNI